MINYLKPRRATTSRGENGHGFLDAWSTYTMKGALNFVCDDAGASGEQFYWKRRAGGCRGYTAAFTCRGLSRPGALFFGKTRARKPGVTDKLGKRACPWRRGSRRDYGEEDREEITGLRKHCRLNNLHSSLASDIDEASKSVLAPYSSFESPTQCQPAKCHRLCWVAFALPGEIPIERVLIVSSCRWIPRKGRLVNVDGVGIVLAAASSCSSWVSYRA